MATMRNRPTIVSVYDSQNDAEQAIRQLYDVGIPKEHISYSSNVSSGGFMETIKHLFSGQPSSPDAVRDDLMNMGLAPDEANYYAQEYHAGHSIVAVSDDQHIAEARTILSRTGAHDFGSRRSSAQTSGAYSESSGYTPSGIQRQPVEERRETDVKAQPFNQTATGRRGNAGDVTPEQERSLRLREEQLRVEKQRVQTGEVSVHKEVVEEQRSIDVPVTHEEVVIETHPTRGIDTSNTPIGEGETIRIPVSEEQVNVSKTQVTTGEVSIGKRAVEETKRVSDTVRHEEARVDEQGHPVIRGTNADMGNRASEDRITTEQDRNTNTINDDVIDDDRRR